LAKHDKKFNYDICASLLSPIPLSCMVVPVRELANKQLSTSTISSKLSNMAHLPSTMDMNINEIAKRRSTSSNKISSKSMSAVSDALFISYHLRMEINNNHPDKIKVEPIDSS